jgi:hypothetical protein
MTQDLQRMKGERLAKLRAYALQKEALDKEMSNWLTAVNGVLGRSFIIPELAASVLANEIKWFAKEVDPYETAEATIERLMTDD